MIRRVQIDEELANERGIRTSTMRDLGQIVLLAGPNGAGKSRYLDAIRHQITRAKTANDSRQQWESELTRIDQNLRSDLPPGLADQLLAQRAQIAKEHNHPFIEFSPAERIPMVIPFDYVAARPKDAEKMVTAELRERLAQTANGAFSTLGSNAHAYLLETARTLFWVRHPDVPESQRVQYQNEVESRNRLLRALLQTEVEVDHSDPTEPRPRLFHRPFRAAELSKGQLVLLAWAIALHKQADRLKDAIIIIDEPEQHLHPAAIAQALDRLRKDILGPDGQIWLATHSASLMSHFGMESVHYVVDGELKWAGSHMDKVMDSLLGGEGNRQQLRTFLGDADQLAFFKMAAECLFPPAVADATAADPQIDQFATIIRDRAVANKPLRVLEYSAGKGRMIEAVLATGTPGQVEYFAYNDPDHTLAADADSCRARLSRLNGGVDAAPFYIEDSRAFVPPRDPGKDVVLLCNVLHEIPVDSWITLFKNQLLPALADDGVVIVMEDQTMNVGELPHVEGFLVLDLIEMQCLFDSADAVRHLRSALEGRLTALEIDRRVLENISPDTIRSALSKLKERCIREVTRLRANGDGGYRQARDHARYLAMLANAELGLRTYAG